MGTVQGTDLNSDSNGRLTSSEFANAGDGVSRWFQWRRTADGGDTTQGAIADVAVTNPASSGSVIALLKGILTATRLSAAGLLKAEDAAHASGDSGVMLLGVRNDARITFAGTDGDYTPASYGTAGNGLVSVVPTTLSAWSPTTYAAHAAASGVIKASAGKLFSLNVSNENAGIRYLMLHNSTTVPADGVAPLFAVKLAAGANIQLDFGAMGLYFSTGISWSFSSTFGTKTIAGADASAVGTYI